MRQLEEGLGGILSENLGAQFEYSNLNPSSEASCAALSKPHCPLIIHYKNLSIIKKLKHGQIGKNTKITQAPSTSEPVTSGLSVFCLSRASNMLGLHLSTELPLHICFISTGSKELCPKTA